MVIDMFPEMKKELENFIKDHNRQVNIIFMDPKNLIFEEQVKMNCFYCGRYGQNWRCPPNLPDIDYKKMFSEFAEGVFIYRQYHVSDIRRYEQIRSESSVEIHRILLDIEKWLWEHNFPTALSFGAGACKLCKDGCGKDKCNNPYLSRSPLEATGVNVIASVKQYGVDISFPTATDFKRIGLVVWQA